MAGNAIDLKLPSAVGDDYLTELAALKPSVNTKQKDSDWWIRSRVVGGVVSGLYADQRLIANDAFPQRARHDALARFLDLYFAGGFLPATPAQGDVIITGTPGQVVLQSMQMTFPSNGNAYTVTANTALPASTGTSVTGFVPVQSVAAGQTQALLPGAILNISSPPAGIQPTAIVGTDGLTDARDPETDDQARARIVQRIRQPLSVGRVSDYIQYAEEANPSVTSAFVLRYPFGLGTVAVYVTAGTTNIDSAIDNGQPISVIPSQSLIDEVQAYLDINRPVTDCVTVLAPVAVAVNVSVEVNYANGTGSTIPSGQTLTQEQLVQREVRRAIYKTPVGGRVIGASGYLVASDIEQTIDVKLSAEEAETGSIPILLDRQVLPLAASGFNRALLPSEVPIPGTITVIPGVTL